MPGGAAAAASSLTDRFVAVIRQSEIGDRRRHDRYPVELEVSGQIGGQPVTSRSIDISRGGMLLDASGVGDASCRAVRPALRSAASARSCACRRCQPDGPALRFRR